MFSGIIEEFATVTAIKHDRENIDFTLTCSFVGELKIDQSVAHNGVCLTVVDISTPDTYTVTAMKETLDRTNLGLLRVGDKVRTLIPSSMAYGEGGQMMPPYTPLEFEIELLEVVKE